MNDKLKKLLGHILVGRHGISEQQFERALSDGDSAWGLTRKVLQQKGALLTEEVDEPPRFA